MRLTCWAAFPLIAALTLASFPSRAQEGDCFNSVGEARQYLEETFGFQRSGGGIATSGLRITGILGITVADENTQGVVMLLKSMPVPLESGILISIWTSHNGWFGVSESRAGGQTCTNLFGFGRGWTVSVRAAPSAHPDHLSLYLVGQGGLLLPGEKAWSGLYVTTLRVSASGHWELKVILKSLLPTVHPKQPILPILVARGEDWQFFPLTTEGIEN